MPHLPLLRFIISHSAVSPSFRLPRRHRNLYRFYRLVPSPAVSAGRWKNPRAGSAIARAQILIRLDMEKLATLRVRDPMYNFIRRNLRRAPKIDRPSIPGTPPRKPTGRHGAAILGNCDLYPEFYGPLGHPIVVFLRRPSTAVSFISHCRVGR